ncbi:MAG: leucine--tRNA ligase [Neisseriaceae bacterium]
MQESYDHKDVEKKHQNKWINNKTFNAPDNSDKPKYYCLSMFAYPSGKLHMGHVRNYTIGDVLARFHKLKGYNVLQPFGWDAFGLPAENAAMQNKVAPAKWTYQNIEYMKSQLQSLGLAIDWSREFATCSPNYYHWQQWLFVQLFKKGIIYRRNGVVNWDPIDQTVLANEQVIDGKGWRSGATIIKKEIPMYYFKITEYAEELLSCLDELDGWPEQVKTMQKNWIGKSKGLEISFLHAESNSQLTVYTTRADTLMGVTFIAIAPEHPLVKLAYQDNPSLLERIKEYHQGGVSEAEIATQEKIGIFSGLYVKHPITGENIEVWIANYVLANYGTGAVMGVPAHCQRDFEFAKKYNMKIKVVIKESACEYKSPEELTHAIADETDPKKIDPNNILVNSGIFDGLNYEGAIDKIHEELAKTNQSKVKINFRLHDWGISRQRYWGCPIPIIYCDICGDLPVPEDQLPVILPEDIVPDGHGSPLLHNKDFISTTCPNCKQPARRETDTMDTFVDSSWYYARFASHNCNDSMLDGRADFWTPVDQYVGGIEHAILHLLYARFFHKCLRDLGLVKSNEPFANLLTQGMVLAETFYQESSDGRKTWVNPADVSCIKNEKGIVISAKSKKDNTPIKIGGMEKMSKSKNNGIDPQFIIGQYGADTARLFMMFTAPPELSLEWSDNGLEGAHRFIKRLWRIVFEHKQRGITSKYVEGELSVEQKKLRTQLHQTIVKVSNDMSVRKQFNTAIANIMELLNSYSKVAFLDNIAQQFAQELLETVVLMLSPIIPHVCEELWQELCPNLDINAQSWPSPCQKALDADEVEMIVQVNGKLRGKIMLAKNLQNEKVEELAKQNANVQKFIEGSIIKKIILVPNKLINIVI